MYVFLLVLLIIGIPTVVFLLMWMLYTYFCVHPTFNVEHKEDDDDKTDRKSSCEWSAADTLPLQPKPLPTAHNTDDIELEQVTVTQQSPATKDDEERGRLLPQERDSTIINLKNEFMKSIMISGKETRKPGKDYTPLTVVGQVETAKEVHEKNKDQSPTTAAEPIETEVLIDFSSSDQRQDTDQGQATAIQQSAAIKDGAEGERLVPLVESNNMNSSEEKKRLMDTTPLKVVGQLETPIEVHEKSKGQFPPKVTKPFETELLIDISTEDETDNTKPIQATIIQQSAAIKVVDEKERLITPASDSAIIMIESEKMTTTEEKKRLIDQSEIPTNWYSEIETVKAENTLVQKENTPLQVVDQVETLIEVHEKPKGQFPPTATEPNETELLLHISAEDQTDSTKPLQIETDVTPTLISPVLTNSSSDENDEVDSGHSNMPRKYYEPLVAHRCDQFEGREPFSRSPSPTNELLA